MVASTREKLASNIGAVIYDELAPIVEGAVADIRVYAFAIARDMVNAAMRGDLAWSKELRAQAKALLEVHRIRAEAASWQAAEKILGVVFKTVFAGLAALVQVAAAAGGTDG